MACALSPTCVKIQFLLFVRSALILVILVSYNAYHVHTELRNTFNYALINARLRIYFLQTMLPCNLPMALSIDRKCKILFDINVWTPLQKSNVSSMRAAHIVHISGI